MPYDAGNRRDIRKAEKLADRIELERRSYLAAALNTVPGRTWFYDLLAGCHLFSDPFTGDALREAYSKGERNVGLRIFADILAVCPDQYIQMMREANERNLAHERDPLSERPSDTDPNRRDQGSDSATDFPDPARTGDD